MHRVVRFEVEGRPATFATKHEAPWRAAVAEALAAAMALPEVVPPAAGARFEITFEFRTPTPLTVSDAWDIDNLIKPTMDAMGGVLTGRKDLVEVVFRFREINGASLAPDPAYLIARGMKTLELRIERQNTSALKIAQFLKAHPKVMDVYYPGLPTHKGHEIARQQMSGFGGMMSFALNGNYDQVKKFLTSLKLVHLAASLGSVSTLAGPPRTTSHVELTEEQRRQLGIPESLIRYSVGIENVEDLIGDLTQALNSL